MKRGLALIGPVLLALAACGTTASTTTSTTAAPAASQAQLESAWQNGQGGTYLAAVSSYLETINANVDNAVLVAKPLAGAASLAEAFPPPIDASAYRQVMSDYSMAGFAMVKLDTNDFVKDFDAAGTVLGTVNAPWTATLPGGSNF